MVYLFICTINIKFCLRNLNIIDLMLINLWISLITNLFFLFFDHHSDKTVTISKLLLSINNFRNKIVDVESLMSLTSKLYELLH